MLTRVRGVLAVVPLRGKMPNLDVALQSISHRAWGGYVSILHRASIYGAAYNSGRASDLGFIHGEVYDGSSRLFDELGTEQTERIASEILILDGSFTFVIPRNNGLFFGRDSLGTKPLYYGRNKKIFVVATERKAIALLGVAEIQSVQPSSIFSFNGYSIRKVASYDYLRGLRQSKRDVKGEIIQALESSVRNRVKGTRKVAVSFSGGVDSSLLASVTAKFSKVLAISVSVKGSHDGLAAKTAAKKLGFDLCEVEVDEREIRERLHALQYIAEVISPIDTSIALGMMFSSEAARRELCGVMLVGQLADEIFGGYRRYLKAYCSEGSRSVQEAMEHDVLEAHRLNFDRDEKASSPNADLLIPYANSELVRLGLAASPDLKFDCKNNSRKIILRDAAKRYGIDSHIADRPKKAFQYSSGIFKIVEKLAN